VATIRFESVSKHFGETVALRDFSLDAGEGEFLVLVGPSGSGKTTALRILAGLEALTDGHVYIGDRVVDRVPPGQRDIAMVFQDYGLYPQMTVFGNMAFGLRMRKVPKAEIDGRVNDAARILDLEDLLDRRPRQLSGGQRQRVALGRALVRQPQAFLMDEPLSNLDAKLRVQTRGEIRRLQAHTGVTTVYVTHDQVEAMTMGDRIAVMNHAVLEQVGTPSEVYESPRNVFVGGFIGNPAMTFGTYAAGRENGSIVLRAGETAMTVPAKDGVPSEVIIGVRPEHTRFWGERDDLLGPLRGRVELVEALGRESLISVAADAGARFIIQAEGLVESRIDDVITFGVRRGHVHLFDPATTEAIGRI
jgi:ABC-type sugar transport system ATPase subunit